ncbi:hypothetical protein [Rhodoferax ferrireducens]|nr:hypothetical protein [Rhodoferax ferrireducens]
MTWFKQAGNWLGNAQPVSVEATSRHLLASLLASLLATAVSPHRSH